MTQATRSALMSVDTTLAANIDATQDYIPVASTANFSTSVVAEIESTNEVVSFATISENQFTFSEEFNNQPISSRITITTNDTTAPDGTTTADKLIQASGQTSNGFVGNLNFTYLSAVYTFSVFLKNGDNNFASLDFGGGVRGWFNLSTGTIGTTAGLISSSISDEGNGWYRCSITATKSAGNSRAILYLSNADNTDDGTPGQFIFAWGSQLEQASSPSTYLPTTSSGLVGLTTVTRGVNGTTAASATSGDDIQQLPYALLNVDMPVRLQGLSVSSDGTGAGRLTLCDKVGTHLCDVDIPDTKIFDLTFDGGILFPNGIYVANSDNITAYTLYTSGYNTPNLTAEG